MKKTKATLATAAVLSAAVIGTKISYDDWYFKHIEELGGLKFTGMYAPPFVNIAETSKLAPEAEEEDDNKFFEFIYKISHPESGE